MISWVGLTIFTLEALAGIDASEINAAIKLERIEGSIGPDGLRK